MRLWVRRHRRWLLGGLLLALAVLLPGAGLLLALARHTLVRSFGVVVDLVGIGLVLFLVAALLAPLQALGWWAGWFGDAEEGPSSLGQLAVPVAEGRSMRRWVVYLDGIGQASQQALPEGEDFLRRLAAALPGDIAILRGIMPYSITNQPLTEGRWLARFWRWVDAWRVRRPLAWLGLLVNLRNLTVVAVSADGRYGPLYNAGMAELIVGSLLVNGYAPGSGTPVTLLGFSGGGQISLGALPHVRQRLAAPVQVISLAGVFAGNNRVLQAEHLFHLVGARDRVAPLGSILFPRRWPIYLFSPWNRALQRGRVSLVPLGPVGHELPGGVMETRLTLPDGRTPMQQTVDLVSAILATPDGGPSALAAAGGNYSRFITNPWHRPDARRDLAPLPDPRLQRRPHWIGRLILPEAARRDGSVGFEVLQTPPGWGHCRGRIAALRWRDPAMAQVTMDVCFSDEARDSARSGNLHPLRLDGWAQVTPLESLAGAHPHDDILVRLPEPVAVLHDRTPAAEGEPLQLEVSAEPLQTAGLARALVRFVRPLEGDAWEALVFDPACGAFTGPPLRLRLPQPVANAEGILPACATGLAEGDLNQEGWEVSGVPDGSGAFVVQALLPRRLRRLAPQRLIPQRRAAWRYLRHQAWGDTTAGAASSVLLAGRRAEAADGDSPASRVAGGRPAAGAARVRRYRRRATGAGPARRPLHGTLRLRLRQGAAQSPGRWRALRGGGLPPGVCPQPRWRRGRRPGPLALSRRAPVGLARLPARGRHSGALSALHRQLQPRASGRRAAALSAGGLRPPAHRDDGPLPHRRRQRRQLRGAGPQLRPGFQPGPVRRHPRSGPRHPRR